MGDGGDGPHVPDFSTDVYAAIRRALQGTDQFSPGDWDAIAKYVNEEYQPLKRSGVIGYLLLGSYRGGFRQRFRSVHHELEKHTRAYPVVLGDTPDIPGISGDLEFFLKYHLLATGADEIVGIYEKDSGGESPELGKVTALYFEDFRVLPKGYIGLDQDALDSPQAVKEAATQIYQADDLVSDQKEKELAQLVADAQDEGVSITEQEVVEHLKKRTVSSASYSWVHLAEFRRLERADRCHPWQTGRELRSIARDIPTYRP